MATYTNEQKSTTRIVNYLRRGVVPNMGQIAERTFDDIGFLDRGPMSALDFEEFVAIVWANLTRHLSVIQTIPRSANSMTWDQDSGTWDENTGIWDSPIFFSTPTKHTAAVTMATKH